jgi:O-antigen ligase
MLAQNMPASRLYYFLLSAFAFLLPMQPVRIPVTIAIMLMGIVWIFTGFLREKTKSFFSNPAAVLVLGYYLWLLLGLFYTQNPKAAQTEIGAKVVLIAWAILLSYPLKLPAEKLRKVLLFFVFGTAAALLLALANALLNYIAFGHSSVFYFQKFSFFYFVPAHYLGLYTNFSYGLILLGLIKFPRQMPPRAILAALFFLFFIGLLLLAVRMQFVVFIFINLGAAIYYVRLKGLSLKALASALASLLLFLGLALSFSGSRARLVDTYHEIRSINQPIDNKQTNPRFFLWPAAMEVIQEHFWIGTGAGSERAALADKLKDNKAKFWDGTKTYYLAEKNYNYHNSFLQHFAAQGIIGLSIFLGMFLLPFFKPPPAAFKPWAYLFLGIVALSFLTESMLQRQAGVLFFSFFYALFFVQDLPAKDVDKAL